MKKLFDTIQMGEDREIDMYQRKRDVANIDRTQFSDIFFFIKSTVLSYFSVNVIHEIY